LVFSFITISYAVWFVLKVPDELSPPLSLSHFLPSLPPLYTHFCDGFKGVWLTVKNWLSHHKLLEKRVFLMMVRDFLIQQWEP
jgi:hypothetical protein